MEWFLNGHVGFGSMWFEIKMLELVLHVHTWTFKSDGGMRPRYLLWFFVTPSFKDWKKELVLSDFIKTLKHYDFFMQFSASSSTASPSGWVRFPDLIVHTCPVQAVIKVWVWSMSANYLDQKPPATEQSKATGYWPDHAGCSVCLWSCITKRIKN